MNNTAGLTPKNQWKDEYESLRLTRSQTDSAASRNGRAILRDRGMAAWLAGLEAAPPPRTKHDPQTGPAVPGEIASKLANIIVSIAMTATTGDVP